MKDSIDQYICEFCCHLAKDITVCDLCESSYCRDCQQYLVKIASETPEDVFFCIGLECPQSNRFGKVKLSPNLSAYYSTIIRCPRKYCEEKVSIENYSTHVADCLHGPLPSDPDIDFVKIFIQYKKGKVSDQDVRDAARTGCDLKEFEHPDDLHRYLEKKSKWYWANHPEIYWICVEKPRNYVTKEYDLLWNRPLHIRHYSVDDPEHNPWQFTPPPPEKLPYHPEVTHVAQKKYVPWHRRKTETRMRAWKELILTESEKEARWKVGEFIEEDRYVRIFWNLCGKNYQSKLAKALSEPAWGFKVFKTKRQNVAWSEMSSVAGDAVNSDFDGEPPFTLISVRDELTEASNDQLTKMFKHFSVKPTPTFEKVELETMKFRDRYLGRMEELSHRFAKRPIYPEPMFIEWAEEIIHSNANGQFPSEMTIAIHTECATVITRDKPGGQPRAIWVAITLDTGVPILECFILQKRSKEIDMHTDLHGIQLEDIQQARELRVVQRQVLERLFLAKKIIGVNLDFHFSALGINPDVCDFLEPRCIDIGLIYSPRLSKQPINFRCLIHLLSGKKVIFPEFSSPVFNAQVTMKAYLLNKHLIEKGTHVEIRPHAWISLLIKDYTYMCQEFNGRWPVDAQRKRSVRQTRNLPWWDAETFCKTSDWIEFHPDPNAIEKNIGTLDPYTLTELIEEISADGYVDRSYVPFESDDEDDGFFIYYPPEAQATPAIEAAPIVIEEAMVDVDAGPHEEIQVQTEQEKDEDGPPPAKRRLTFRERIRLAASRHND